MEEAVIPFHLHLPEEEPEGAALGFFPIPLTLQVQSDHLTAALSWPAAFSWIEARDRGPSGLRRGGKARRGSGAQISSLRNPLEPAWDGDVSLLLNSFIRGFMRGQELRLAGGSGPSPAFLRHPDCLPVLRFPGGRSENWHWSLGIGPGKVSGERGSATPSQSGSLEWSFLVAYFLF